MVTIVIPALNEEKHLGDTVEKVIRASGETGGAPIEIILVNDGSTDRTGEVVASFERKYPFVRSIHHDTNVGIGQSFLDALAIARSDRIGIIPGDNLASLHMIKAMLANAHKADFVAAYIINTESRTTFRHVLSMIYSMIYVVTFGVHLRYIHPAPVYPVTLLRSLTLHSKRYALFSEIHIKLLRKGVSFFEIGSYISPANSRKSSAIRLKVLFEVVKSYLRLIGEVYFSRRAEYSTRPVRVLPDDAL